MQVMLLMQYNWLSYKNYYPVIELTALSSTWVYSFSLTE